MSPRSSTPASGSSEALDLPPGFTGITLREYHDAVKEACARAAEHGAGTLFWVRRFDTIEFAVVLEPEETLVTARRALFAVMNAAVDALAAHVPPERPIALEWPDTIVLDGGVIGGARLAAPPGCSEDEVPEWLVAGIVLRNVVPVRTVVASGGHQLDTPHIHGTSLEAEGIEIIDGAAIIASFARHLMVYFDLWQEKGFQPVAEQFLAHIPEAKGFKRGIDFNGDLLMKYYRSPDKVERRDLKDELAAPQWMDPKTGEPWL